LHAKKFICANTELSQKTHLAPETHVQYYTNET
jgi:hypothetical protein